jgi:hypothetical protein
LAISQSTGFPISARLALAESGKKSNESAPGMSGIRRNNQKSEADYLVGAFFVRDMLPTILLWSVLIYWEFIPSGELITSKQKNHAKNLPSLDFLQVWLVHPLFLDRAYAIDAYKWDRRWKIHVVLWERCPSFPVSFWAFKTVGASMVHARVGQNLVTL